MYHIASSTCTMLLSRLQTRCKHPIYSYPNVQARLSFCTYFLLYPLVITLQDWSVNHVRKLKCQPCMEAAQLAIISIVSALAVVMKSTIVTPAFALKRFFNHMTDIASRPHYPCISVSVLFQVLLLWVEYYLVFHRTLLLSPPHADAQ